MSWSVQMWGCESFETALASRSRRCRKEGSEDRSAGRTLRATSRSRRVSRARYTSPMPPAPSGRWISYGPSLVPEFSTKPLVSHAISPDSFPFAYAAKNGSSFVPVGRPLLARIIAPKRFCSGDGETWLCWATERIDIKHPVPEFLTRSALLQLHSTGPQRRLAAFFLCTRLRCGRRELIRAQLTAVRPNC